MSYSQFIFFAVALAAHDNRGQLVRRDYHYEFGLLLRIESISRVKERLRAIFLEIQYMLPFGNTSNKIPMIRELHEQLVANKRYREEFKIYRRMVLETPLYEAKRERKHFSPIAFIDTSWKKRRR